MAPVPAGWNARTSFSRIISSSARNVTIMNGLRAVAVGEQLLEPAGVGLRQPRQQLRHPRSSIEICSGGITIGGLREARSSTPRNAAIRLKRSTSSSGS